MDDTNKRIGDYEILNELGSGGMGRVYRVRNVISDRIEAMKIVLPDLAGRQELADRFLREIKVLASLDHPNIAALRTALTVNNQLVMIMEYVEGRSLGSRLKHGPIALAEAVHYIDQALGALSYAHQKRVIHRDIKPDNMMVTPQDVLKLMDFGIARSGEDRTLTVVGTTPGSVSYMSPEQVKGETLDARSDLYSMGISFYEMVTGQRPFQGDSDFALMVAHVETLPKPPIELQPGLGADLNEIILKALAKDPADRFQSADAFREALSKVQPASATMHDRWAGSSSDDAPTVLPGHPALTASKGPSVPAARVNPPQAPAAVQASAKKGHPGLYMVLGGLVVVGALVGAGLYIGRAEATPEKNAQPAAGVGAPPAAEVAQPSADAGGQPSADVAQPAGRPAVDQVPPASSPQPDAQQPPSAVPTEAPVQAGSVTPRPVVRGSPVAEQERTQRGTSTRTAITSNDSGQAQQPVASAPTAQPAVDLEELEREIDQLTVRAGALNRSLDRLQEEQARQGLGLRGDIASRHESMNLNLSKAQEAYLQRDAARATRYKRLAESDVEALERFLRR
jgi:eukaryotic-like serine/threonine-protein kinase